jgi:hypothetical protein
MSYQTKYNKKILNFKKNYQIGGTECNLSNWTEKSNNGQKNCGIFIHNTDSTLIMKCGEKLSSQVDDINSKVSIFPTQYSECTDEKGNNYLIMERLDGDITSIYFNILPIYVLTKMNLDNMTKHDIKMIFDIKTPTTVNPIIPYEQQVDILKNISDSNKTITLELYDEFINKLTTEWNNYHKIIIKEIIRILIKLTKLNYKYDDMKFDNFGYKLSETVINKDFRKDNVPKLFGKYFYVYILDPASGLHSLIDGNENLENYFKYNKNFDEIRGLNEKEIEEIISKFKKIIDLTQLKEIYKNGTILKNKNSYLNYLLDKYNNGFDLSVNGQYNLSRMNQQIRKINNNKTYKSFDILPYCSIEVKKILDKEYKFPLNKYNFDDIEKI